MDLNFGPVWGAIPLVLLVAAAGLSFAYDRLRQKFDVIDADRSSYLQVLERSNDALFVIGFVDGRVLHTNDRAAALLGRTRAFLEQATIFDLHPKTHIAASAERIADAWAAGGLVYEDIPMLAADGTEIPVQSSTKVSSYGDRPAIILFARDIRERLRLEGELTIQREAIREKNRAHLASLEYASRIQRAMLPSKCGLGAWFTESLVMYRPRDVVSGDLYWYAEHRGKVVVAAADCTGHGVPGGFLSMVGLSLLRRIVIERGMLDPAEILDELRAGVIEALSTARSADPSRDGMDISLVTFDPGTRTLEFAGAFGSIHLMRRNEDGTELEEIKGDRMPIGWQERGMVPFKSHRIQLHSGDRVYLCSDGYADQFGGPAGKKLKVAGFRSILQAVAHLPMHRQATILERAFDAWKGTEEQVDDVLVLGFRV